LGAKAREENQIGKFVGYLLRLQSSSFWIHYPFGGIYWGLMYANDHKGKIIFVPLAFCALLQYKAHSFHVFCIVRKYVMEQNCYECWVVL